MKLNIGSGDHPLGPDWINADLMPHAGGLYMDATKRFPFRDGEIDRIFSEHMIEHVPLAGGLAMLGECYRVLRPGGRIRISTPSLEFLFGLWQRPTEETERYVKWACRIFSPAAPVCAETVINNFVRAWGHQFIWSREMLVIAMTDIGFRAVASPKIGESEDPEFVGLENASRMPEGYLQLETMTIEAEKPA
jgi:predicted SAM-dependent methyltransferase